MLVQLVVFGVAIEKKSEEQLKTIVELAIGKRAEKLHWHKWGP